MAMLEDPEWSFKAVMASMTISRYVLDGFLRLAEFSFSDDERALDDDGGVVVVVVVEADGEADV